MDMMKNNVILYAVFSRRVANILEKQGFRIVKMEPNHKNEKYLVYYFEDSVEFRDALRPLITKNHLTY